MLCFPFVSYQICLFYLFQFFFYGYVKIKNKVTGKVFKVNSHQLKLFHESPQVEEEFVVNLSLVLPILCDDVPWMAHEEFPFPFLSLRLHFITCSHWGQCAFQVWGKGLENSGFSIFLFSLFSIVMFVSIFCLYLFFVSI